MELGLGLAQLGNIFGPKIHLKLEFDSGDGPNFQNKAFLLLYYSDHKKATYTVFIQGDRGYPLVHVEYKMVYEVYLVAENIKKLNFFENI